MATIKAPVATFNGTVGGVQFANGTAETDNQAVINYCKGAGYTVVATKEKEPAGPFDPSKHNTAEVLAYLGVSEGHEPPTAGEFERVVQAEEAGKNRSTLLAAIATKKAEWDAANTGGTDPASGNTTTE